MANTVIKLKKSAVAFETPSSLEYGELAINYADGKLFYKNSTGDIVSFSAAASGVSFGTINANNSLVVAGGPSSILTLKNGDNIEITSDIVNDIITFTANLKPAFDVANAAYNAANAVSGGIDVTAIYDQSNAAFDKANSANVLAYNTGIGANAYINTSLTSANNYAGAMANAVQYYVDVFIVPFANTIGVNANTYANTIALAANNYAGVMANSANAYAASLTPDLTPAFSKANDAYAIANAAFDRANLSNDILFIETAFNTANSAYDKANSANSLAYDTGIGANAYAVSIGASSNDYVNVSTNSANNYAGGMTNSSNGYAETVGLSGNTYANLVGTSGNSYTVSVGVSGNAYVNVSTTAANNYAGVMANSANVFTGTVYTAVNSVFSVANAAFGSVNTVGGYVNTVGGYANTAGSYANQAGVIANASFEHSNTTYGVVNSAFAVINAAFGSVNTVGGYANTVGGYANQAGVIANAAFGHSNLTYAAVNSAFGVINSAFGLANTTANDLANTAVAANNYAGAMANSSNGYALTLSGQVLSTANNYAGEMANASNTWANTKLANTSDIVFAGNLTFTGAVNTVSLKSNTYIDFDKLPYNSTLTSYKEGRMWYDNDTKSIQLYSDYSDFTQSFGEREWVRVRNSSGATILKGKPVYVTGVHIPGHPIHGHHPTVALANAGDISKREVLGLTGHDIPDGSHGFVVTRGYIEGINTASLTSGSRVHLGFANDGDLIPNAPEYPNYPMDVGLCLTANSTNGTMYVSIFDHSFERLRVDASARFGGDVTVEGDFTVLGTQTVTSTTSMSLGTQYIYMSEGDSIPNANITFTGSGLNDLDFQGHYDRSGNTNFYVKITEANATGDYFSWSYDNFATVEASNTKITYQTPQYLSNGISVYFQANTGHTIGAKWNAMAVYVSADFGIVGNHDDGGSYTHAGMFRDATDGVFKFFSRYDAEPNGNIDIANSTFVFANVQMEKITANTVYASGADLGAAVVLAFDKANASYSTANGAYDKANSANVLAYNTGIGANAYTNVSTVAANNYAGVMANGAGTIANASFGHSNLTYTAVNSAFGVINAAFGSANTVGGYVNTVGGYANTAGTYANTAGGNANQAGVIANAAFGHSNITYTAVNSAFGVINAAFGSANTVGGYANTAGTYANTAGGNANQAGVIANAAFGHSNTTYAAVNSAFGVINASFSKANTALQNTTGVFAGSLDVTAFLNVNSAMIVGNSTTAQPAGSRVAGITDVVGGYGVYGYSSGSAGYGTFGGSSSGTGGYFTSVTGKPLLVEYNGSAALTVFNTGNVAIKRTTANYHLDVAGSINCAAILVNGVAVGVNVGATAPSSPSVGNLWWNTNLGRMFIYYTDVDSSQWVETSPYTTLGETALQNTTGVFAGSLTTTGGIADSKGDVRDIPVNNQTASYILTLADTGKVISLTTGNVYVTASVFFAGNTVSIFNNSSANITITQNTSVTLYSAGTANTGNRILQQRGIATLLCVAANTFVVTGAGIVP